MTVRAGRAYLVKAKLFQVRKGSARPRALGPTGAEAEHGREQIEVAVDVKDVRAV